MSMTTKEVLDAIFKDPNTQYQLSEFDSLGKPVEKILSIYPKEITSGRDAGKTKYYLKSFVPFMSGTEELQVYVDGGKANPEEIVRQLWVYKLIHHYHYSVDEISLEVSVNFGTEVSTKAADIIVYTNNVKDTPKIIIECKKPKRKDGIEQLKSYMNAKGAPVAVWSNGLDRVILYRPYPNNYEDTLSDIPAKGQEPKDVLNSSRTLSQLKTEFNFRHIIEQLEELVLADSGKDEFNEIFKLIFAKIWDEKQAEEVRPDHKVEFRKALDEEITYDRINDLFHKACEEWQGIFKEGEDIELTKRHLQVCVGPIEDCRLMGSNLRIMDDAFEYLLPTEAKKKKGQFFTPRPVVEMCVRMLNPKRNEYVIDPSCGSGGFLLHAMEWCYPANDSRTRADRKSNYASKYLWGIDFETRAAKTSRALMLIAGDGHTRIFGPDVSSIEPKSWFENNSGRRLMQGLRDSRLTAVRIPENEPLNDDEKAWTYFDELKFDVVLANPPFAGEIKDRQMLAHYDLAKPALKRAGGGKAPKEERDVLFIERILKMLRPGGRAAIVLPQGKFNNSSLAFIREWILKRARLLAVVGLHGNTFKPHTGTKTSVLVVQKYTKEQLSKIEEVEKNVEKDCPDYDAKVKELLDTLPLAIPDDMVPDDIFDVMNEFYGEPESEDSEDGGEESSLATPEERLSDLVAQIDSCKTNRNGLEERLHTLENDVQTLKTEQDKEIASIRERHSGGERTQLVKEARSAYGTKLRELKDRQKEEVRAIKAEIKRIEKALPQMERDAQMLTNRGRLELMRDEGDAIEALRSRWVAAEAAKRLDYPIFMAVSERGGKNNSGEYLFRTEPNGAAARDANGQLVIDQDLVNFDITPAELKKAAEIPEAKLCIAEAFVRFAQDQNLDFWRAD